MSAQLVHNHKNGVNQEKKNPSGKTLIICDFTKCNACYLCEYICSLIKYNQIRPFLARIKADKHTIEFPIAIACRQCEDAPCIKVCSTEALSMGDALTCDPEKCTFCGWCIDACPFGALNVDYDAKKVVACDLCPENRIDDLPPCVALCPREALSEVTWDSLREKGKDHLQDNLLLVEHEG